MKLAVRSQFILRSQLYFSLGPIAGRDARSSVLPRLVPRFAPRRAVPATRCRRRARVVPERPRAGL
ncbi:hypothetical protein [Burkholderia plantarii]|uniref:hypothetical protein n=1 Tax=Burkholderia plantarii TaxID=41899 RepID=UPI000870AF96|nr:hypothetical protein [Burkholderia plantarii]WLE58902.1 hypothetical protein GIY62_17635 [Burkholderia plantarii]GLZ21978.1 hypothetical protein Bpla01_55070 [Burkholderia plantarii]